jgi:phytol kinase
MSDPVAVIFSFLYVAVVLGIAESIRKRFNLKKDFTRKFVHIFIGTFIVPTFFIFKSLYFALVPPIVFILVNLISYRFKIFKAMEEEDGKNLGTMLFPISFCIVMILFWNVAYPYRVAAMMGILVMAWGDASASLVGRNFGTHFYHFFKERKSVEGSIAMFVMSYIALLIVLTIWQIPWLDINEMMITAAIVALFGTFLEAISVRGFDNLIVPVCSSIAAFFVMRLFSPHA